MRIPSLPTYLLYYLFVILFVGDEILAVNGKSLHDLTHQDALAVFKNIKRGPVNLHIITRLWKKDTITEEKTD